MVKRLFQRFSIAGRVFNEKEDLTMLICQYFPTQTEKAKLVSESVKCYNVTII